MEHYFRSRGYLADDRFTAIDGTAFRIGELPPFLRTLLVADGTVTKSLEAWFWEPVQVTVIGNVESTLQRPIEGLEAEIGHKVLVRKVCLRGRESATDYAYARSTLARCALPEEISAGLLTGKIGIGEVLREQNVETYREVIALDYLPANHPGEWPLPFSGSDVVSRSYRIRVCGVPAILVTEYFPVEVYLTQMEPCDVKGIDKSD